MTNDLDFPLHKPILLITNGGKYICKIIFSDKKRGIVIAVDVCEKILTPNGEYLYSDDQIGGKITFMRNQIVGFRDLSQEPQFIEEIEYDEKVYKSYSDTVAKYRRSKFRVITPIKTNTSDSGGTKKNGK